MPLILFALVLAWTVMLLFGGMDMDRALLAVLYGGDRPRLSATARLLTELGGAAVVIPLALAGAAWLVVRIRFRAALLLLAITFGGRALVEIQKVQTARIRPEEHEHLVQVQTLSFPSGHAANATMIYLSLALLLTTSFPHRALALWAAVWMALLVGTSRVVLGVHWPSDVIAGWAFGLLWTLLLLSLSGHELGDGAPRPPPAPGERGASGETGR